MERVWQTRFDVILFADRTLMGNYRRNESLVSGQKLLQTSYQNLWDLFFAYKEYGIKCIVLFDRSALYLKPNRRREGEAGR